ncbi:hypothetical protein [Hymenobacter sp. APR13]|uniref:hypothetical protein n=1 Tax=Hymenobacter sp. APR13 TaxID=1356852 RepID=UPI0004E08EA7|nr:hypothetical protein [Hymenobacter sp. APR13]AII53816.1 hypothetical protein N008_17765 [Hymenobacter sp. APR13]
MHITHGYHTVRDTEDPDKIERDAPFKCTRSDAWLSEGYYFWEKDLERAHQWGKGAYKQREGVDYVILRAELTLARMLDLVGDPEHQKFMRDMVNVMRQEDPTWRASNQDPPLGTILALLRLRASKSQAALFPYDSVRGQDHPKPTQHRFVRRRQPDNGSDNLIDLNPRVQICVFHKSAATLQNVRIVFPEHYV